MLGRAHSDHCQRIVVGVIVVGQNRDGHGRILFRISEVVRGHRGHVRHHDGQVSESRRDHFCAGHSSAIDDGCASRQSPGDGYWERDGNTLPAGDHQAAGQDWQVAGVLGYGASRALQRYGTCEGKLAGQSVGNEHAVRRVVPAVLHRDPIGDPLPRSGE